MKIAQPISCEADAPTDVSDHEDVVEEIQSQDCFDESESSHSQGTMMKIAQPISCEAEAPTDVSDHEDVVEEIQSQDCFDESESSLNRSMATSRAEHHAVAEEDLTVEDAENTVADRQAVVSDTASASDAVKNAAAVDEPSNETCLLYTSPSPRDS